MSLNQLLNPEIQPWSDLYCNSLTSEQTLSPNGSVTQLVSTTSNVTLNARAGIITTFAQTLAGAGALEFEVFNSYVKADSNIVCAVTYYTGAYATNGFPVVNAQHNSLTGGFFVKLNNLHASNALSGVLNISFYVL